MYMYTVGCTQYPVLGGSPDRLVFLSRHEQGVPASQFPRPHRSRRELASIRSQRTAGTLSWLPVRRVDRPGRRGIHESRITNHRSPVSVLHWPRCSLSSCIELRRAASSCIKLLSSCGLSTPFPCCTPASHRPAPPGVPGISRGRATEAATKRIAGCTACCTSPVGVPAGVSLLGWLLSVWPPLTGQKRPGSAKLPLLETRIAPADQPEAKSSAIPRRVAANPLPTRCQPTPTTPRSPLSTARVDRWPACRRGFQAAAACSAVRCIAGDPLRRSRRPRGRVLQYIHTSHCGEPTHTVSGCSVVGLDFGRAGTLEFDSWSRQGPLRGPCAGGSTRVKHIQFCVWPILTGPLSASLRVPVVGACVLDGQRPARLDGQPARTPPVPTPSPDPPRPPTPAPFLHAPAQRRYIFSTHPTPPIPSSLPPFPQRSHSFATQLTTTSRARRRVSGAVNELMTHDSQHQ
jgi:hypothetical protein